MDGFQLSELAAMLDESMKLAEKSASQPASAAPLSSKPNLPKPAPPTVESTFGQGFKAPEYTFLYKQRVEASEVYGGFSGQTPSNADSQYLVISMKLPGEVLSDIDLDVTETTLTLYAKLHRLHLSLPHPVDPKDIKASFANQALRITLRRTDVLLL